MKLALKPISVIAVVKNVLSEPDTAAPDKNEFNELVGEIKRLIERFSLENVKRAIAEADSEFSEV